MPLKTTELPPQIRTAVSRVYQMAIARGAFPTLREADPEQTYLVAPHRMYALGLDGILSGDFSRAVPTGWRFLVADRRGVLASAEVGGDHGAPPILNSGPFVASTAAAIDDLEHRPEIVADDYELRLLKVPALYIVAAWLIGRRRFVFPLHPAPPFLEEGMLYSEPDFMEALREPAMRVLDFPEASGG